MTAQQNNTDNTTDRTRLHYLPLDQAKEGMTLGEAIILTEHHVVRFRLPAGHALTEGDLRQLTSHRAECVCVALPDTRSHEEIAADTAAATDRVMHIFAGADFSQPVLASLLERVLTYRSR